MIMKKLISLIGTFVLALLGFSGCGEDGILGPGDIMVAYGTPTGKFKVDVRVTDEQGKPVKDIKVVPVVLHAPNYDIRRSVLDTISTDAAGKASYIYDFWWVSDDVHVIFEDTDGGLNGGTFVKDSVSVKPVKTKEGKGWNVGEYAISVTKKLKKK